MHNTITIGIPVFNEAQNIKRLLISIMSQNLGMYKLSKIIISSDGSTDDTIEEIKKINSKLILTIANKNRKGIARGLNQIIKRSNSDVLLTLDGDIKIIDDLFIQKLVEPILVNNIDHTSSAICEIAGKSFFSRSLQVSMKIKHKLFELIDEGNNIYTCHGLARAYSKKFYKKLFFPVSIGNDMYSYLLCKSTGFKYKHVSSAIAWYRLPDKIIDHKIQSVRFLNSYNLMESYFETKFLNSETKINIQSCVICILKSIVTIILHPIHILFYVTIWFDIKYVSRKQQIHQAWDLSTSTKNL